MKAKHLIFGGQLIFSPRRFVIGDQIFRVPSRSFKEFSWEAKEYAENTLPTRRFNHDKILVGKLEEAKLMTGIKLSIIFQHFENFSDYFNFDRYYAVRIYQITKIEEKTKQLSLEDFSPKLL